MAELIEHNTGTNQHNVAVGCHLLGFLIFVIPGVGHILGPLALWLLKRDGNPFVDDQGKEALNFQISYTFWALVALALAFTLFWTVVVPLLAVVALVVLAVVWFVAMLVAAARAGRGHAFRYPLTLRLIA